MLPRVSFYLVLESRVRYTASIVGMVSPTVLGGIIEDARAQGRSIGRSTPMSTGLTQRLTAYNSLLNVESPSSAWEW